MGARFPRLGSHVAVDLERRDPSVDGTQHFKRHEIVQPVHAAQLTAAGEELRGTGNQGRADLGQLHLGLTRRRALLGRSLSMGLPVRNFQLPHGLVFPPIQLTYQAVDDVVQLGRDAAQRVERQSLALPRVPDLVERVEVHALGILRAGNP